jgi:uncharacterized protein (TIGR02996 family)
MSMHDAFLAEIAANPEDGPRLVSAGWLDDNGDPDRAAIILADIAANPDHDAPRRRRLEEPPHPVRCPLASSYQAAVHPLALPAFQSKRSGSSRAESRRGRPTACSDSL